MGLTPEQEEKLAMINSTEGGKNFSSPQKAVVMKFGTIAIKADKPKSDKSKSDMSVDIPAGPQVKPILRKGPTIED